MPDGDFVAHKPTGKYGNAADRLGGGTSLEDVAQDIGDALAGTIRKYGDEPIQILDTTASVIAEATAENSLGGDTDWVEASYKLDMQMRETWGNRDGLEVALDTGKVMFLDAQDRVQFDNPMMEAVTRYIWRIYEAHFEHSAPLDAIYTNHDLARLTERVQELRPHVKPYVDDMARRIAGSGHAKNIKSAQLGEKKPSVMDDLWGEVE